MTPRIPLPGISQCCRASLLIPTASHHPTSLLPLLSRLALTAPPPTTACQSRQQARHASVLGDLRNNPGAVKNRTRVGRGPSSGHGKTSGRGHKGTLQRGKVNPWFQGGQTPLIVSRGQKGEDNVRALDLAEVNLDSIQAWIDQGRLDPTRQITPKELIECGLARVRDGVKILARNATALTTPINVMASRASEAAIKAIEDAGGRIVTRYYTKDSIRRLLAGESVNTELPLAIGKEHVSAAIAATRGPDGRRLYRLPDPTGRWDIEYYRDPKHRGYLSPFLKEGETPSLFHKVPKPIDDEELKRLMQVKMEKLRAKGREKKTDKRLF